MTSDSDRGLNRRLCTVLFVESDTRWRHSLQHFFASDPRWQDRLLLRTVAVEQARALAVSVRPLVIFWELRGAEANQLSKAISIVSRLHQPPLQFGCVPQRCQWSHEEFLEISVSVRRLGISSVLKNPEDLRPTLRLIDRYLRRG